jgi:hypothetical protein
MLLVQQERKFYDNRIVHNQKELLGEFLGLGGSFRLKFLRIRVDELVGKSGRKS